MASAPPGELPIDADFIARFRDHAGISIPFWENRRRMEALLADLWEGSRGQLFALKTALREGVVDELASSSGSAFERSRLSAQLEKNDLPPTTCRWAVEVWARILGLQPASSTVPSPGSPQETRRFEPPEGSSSPARSVGSPEEDARRGTAGALVVARTGPSDFKSLAEAVAAAPVGARIVVGPGSYRGPIVLDKSLEIVGSGKRQDIVVESAGASCVVMSGEWAKVSGVTMMTRPTPAARNVPCVGVLSGRLVLEDCDLSSECAFPCVYVHDAAAHAVMRRCSIHDSAGAGVSIGPGAGTDIEKCEIAGNASGGIRIEGGHPRIVGCRIHAGGGPGIYLRKGARGTIEECDIFANDDAGVQITEGSDPVLRKCEIHNGDSCGVLLLAGAKGSIEDCNIFGNAMSGIEVREKSDPRVRRCTIRDGGSAGLYVHSQGRGTFEGCDIHGNRGRGLLRESGGNPVLQSCTVRANRGDEAQGPPPDGQKPVTRLAERKRRVRPFLRAVAWHWRRMWRAASIAMNNDRARKGLLLGLLSMFAGVFGLILGGLGLLRSAGGLRDARYVGGGRVMAWIGIVSSLVGIAIGISMASSS